MGATARSMRQKSNAPDGVASPTARSQRDGLRALSAAWRVPTRSAKRRAFIVGLLLVFVMALLVGRGGTPGTRIASTAVIALWLVLGFSLRVHAQRLFADPNKMVAHVGGQVDREAASRVLRALSLLEPHAAQGSSPELAELHVTRAIEGLSLNQVRRRAKQVCTRLGVMSLAFAGMALAVSASNPWGLFEGANVLLAREGIAPLSMAWVSEPTIRVRPPDYLHQEEKRIEPYEPTSLPAGTLITVRGTPVHDGRRLVLTDGTTEVSFVDDGAGMVVARWTLDESVRLRVVARFGEVVIREASETSVEAILDAVPSIQLDGAPKQIRLAAEQDVSDIPIHYEASDDHGLREVDLVLRSGASEDRRVLSKLDGETKRDRGGLVLRTNDRFLRRSHAPIEVRVEAKDNDPIHGPKWGASAAITILPPDVGEPEAIRRGALMGVRDALVDALASRLSTPLPTDFKERKSLVEHDVELAVEGTQTLERALVASHAGIRVPSRLGAMLRGRMRKVREAVDNQLRSPSTAARATVLKATERMVLVVDAAMQGLALRDTQSVARELADVADELVASAMLVGRGSEQARGEQRMDAAVLVLDGGARSLLRLGALGRDLGEIVQMDLRRVDRARKTRDSVHAILAAQDLAARLRQPDPSFGSRGGRPSHAGVGSGGASGQGGEEADSASSDVEQAFNEAAQDLERLASEHAGAIGNVEKSLAGGATKEDLEALSEDAKKHAMNLREAARQLPNMGGGSDSWTSKGAAAREHAEQAAKAMEQGNVSDALEGARHALAALDEAKKMAARESAGQPEGASHEQVVDESRRRVKSELTWAEEKLEQLRRRAAERARPELREHGDAESKLAERARELSRKGHDQEALPPAALDALHDAERAAQEASKALREGDAKRGLEKQREAQRKLEMAKSALGESESNSSTGDDSRPARNDHADIPGADSHKGPEDFRRRVLKGLGQPAGTRYEEAVKRYAEGLLR
jgi:hypothetical protein